MPIANDPPNQLPTDPPHIRLALSRIDLSLSRRRVRRHAPSEIVKACEHISSSADFAS